MIKLKVADDLKVDETAERKRVRYLLSLLNNKIDNFKFCFRQILNEIDRLEKQSMRDDLTGLLRRGAFFECLKDLFKKDEPEIGTSTEGGSFMKDPVAIFMVDIDHFKKVNDEYGHLVGDKVLERVAKLLQEYASHDVQVGRFGGEEFVLGVSAPKEKVFEMALKLKKRVPAATEIIPGGLTVSIGISFCEKEEDIMHSLNQADRALYKAKEAGRNCIKVVNNSNRNKQNLPRKKAS